MLRIDHSTGEQSPNTRPEKVVRKNRPKAAQRCGSWAADFTIDSLHLEATAFWCVVPVHSNGVVVANTTIHARDKGDGGTPNTDGIEPMWSQVSRTIVAGN